MGLGRDRNANRNRCEQGLIVSDGLSPLNGCTRACICLLETPLGGVFFLQLYPCFSRSFVILLNGPRPLSKFTIGTFNVRGLSSASKRDQLSEYLNKLYIDVCCIQETKCPSGFDVISGYYRLIRLHYMSRHYGLAFAVASYLADCSITGLCPTDLQLFGRVSAVTLHLRTSTPMAQLIR